MSKLKQLLLIATGGTALFASHALYSGNPKFYANVVMPTLHKLTSAETAHNMGVAILKYGLYPRCRAQNYDNLQNNIFDWKVMNPVGLAAGFDKHCEAIDGLLNLGFGFIEVGGVTPEPQPGNEKPRVFRLHEDKAIINRYGFNSFGHQPAVVHVENWYNKLSENKRGYVGVNLGKNKSTLDAAQDYVKGVENFGPYVDFLVINVSSPNTPGLRKLQAQDQLQTIIKAVVEANSKLERENKPPIFVKIAPDLSESDKVAIATVVAARDSGIDGLVISNTTLSRPESLQNKNKVEVGGLSGAPLRQMSTDLIRDMYRLTFGRVVIIGVGGVFSGQDALDKIKAGASLVQIYSSLAYEGPPVVEKIKKELSELLKKEGFENVSDAVGYDVKEDKCATS